MIDEREKNKELAKQIVNAWNKKFEDETDKEFEALHTAPTTQAPKNIDMMYNQMMERLAREEEERRKQAALEATIASQTAEQNIILPTPKPTPKPTTKPPAYDYSHANESWILF